MAARFLTLADVTEILNISAAQAYALVRTGELPAIQIGGRGQWRVESTELEAYIQRMYAQARSRIDAGQIDESPSTSETADQV
ncbi:helix-turn-helix domain-containing protein [Actinotalea sp. BY-33]|uniref:Helix-turn-helix domain-containing protein n=1 Tax=Actinotalea soli TaxID=2819234 RepID=A0A939LNP9_9CELL|nr:helix-turn-helix domain-containing protein [Actinotalea soli]MBO1750899.1 helix-turn-helix domain-containing protein [Actinotalea soli]